MKKRVEIIAAVIFFILMTAFLFMALAVRYSSTMDPIRQQIKEEIMII